MADHEFDCANYASKEQPHIDGLLHALADSVKSLEYSLAKAEDSGDEPLEALERARRLLHRLLSATNRRMHKGFPEMLSYLLGKPSEYASHEFVPLPLDGSFRRSIREFSRHAGLASADAGPDQTPRKTHVADASKRTGEIQENQLSCMRDNH